MKLVYSFMFCTLLSTMVVSQCYLDRHSTVLDDAWLSCEIMPSPNDVREDSHWILYDLSEVHILGQSHFWNINTPGNTEMGASRIALDLSRDGILWEEWGEFELAEAAASGFYEGESGPDFQGLEARFILITILDNHGSNCAGLSEVRFESMGISTSTETLALEEQALRVHPNPALDHTNIEFESLQDMEISISIIDMVGQEVLRQTQQVFQGSNRIRLDLANLSPANYILNIESHSAQVSTQLSIINK